MMIFIAQLNNKNSFYVQTTPVYKNSFELYIKPFAEEHKIAIVLI
jgi:hypothetical protein